MNKMNLTNQQIQQSEALFLEMAIDTIRLDAITSKVKAVRAALEQTHAKTIQPTQATSGCRYPDTGFRLDI